jgi:hypothetical protein
MAINPRQMLGLGGTRPSMQYQQLNQTYQSDPRRILGEALMGQGTSTAPVRTPLAGLGRLSSALVGAYLQRKAGDAQVEREGEYRTQLASALTGLGDNVPSAITAIGSVPGNELAALNAAASYQATVAAREPKTPVQMFNRKTRQVIPVIPGSPEQTQAFNDGFEMGNLPNPESGFMFKDGEQVVRPGGKEARAQRDKFVEPIRKEEVKFNTADIAFKNAKDFVASPSGGSDTALIYNFFTTLDPGGRVTDGEAQMAQASESFGNQFAVKLRQGLQSGVLSADSRNEILKVMQGLVNQRRSNLQTAINNTASTIATLGFTPQNTFTYYPQIFSAAATVPSISNNPDDSIVGGEQISPADGSNADPSITNATDDDLLRSLF